MSNKIDCLVISGGSIKGFGLLGAIQYIYENYSFETLETFIGTSVGSIICYLLCIGYKPLEIVHHINRTGILRKLSKEIDFTALLTSQGIMSLDPILDEIEFLTLAKHDCVFTFQSLYETLGKEFVCMTYNYTKQQSELLHYKTTPNLSCITALKMSCSIPFIFEKCVVSNYIYVDGGTIDNFQIRTALKLNKQKIIGVVNQPTTEERPPDSESMMSFLQRIIFTPIIETTRKTIRKYNRKKYHNRIQIVEIQLKQHFLNFGVEIADIMNMFSDGYTLCKNKLFI
jgi:predicted acylesterase/phospholipase RssA